MTIEHAEQLIEVIKKSSKVYVHVTYIDTSVRVTKAEAIKLVQSAKAQGYDLFSHTFENTLYLDQA